MRISVVTPRFFPHLGGIEVHIAELVTRFAAAGHDVTVLTQDGRRPPAGPVDPPGIRVRRFPSVLPFRGQGVSAALRRAVNRDLEQAEIVHFHNYHAAVTPFAAARSPRPRLVTPHYLGSGTTPATRAMHTAYRPLGRALVTGADAVICVSRAEADMLARELRVPSVPGLAIIPNGVRVAALRSARPADYAGPLVLVACRLEAYKRADLAIRALSQLDPDVGLVIAGTGPHRPALEQLITALGLSDRVRMLGHISGEEMARWYRRADAVVSLSDRECFGLTVAEAIAAETAIVATDIPAHREIIEGTGYPTSALVPVNTTPDTVAQAIRLALKERPAAERAPLDWDAVALRTLELYESLHK